MSVLVMRYKRRRVLNDIKSPEFFYLRPVKGRSRIHTIESMARDIETIGSLSTEDVTHVMQAFVRRLRAVLTQGDQVKVDGLGRFFTTFNCLGSVNEKDCTVRNIRTVNIRFAVDNALRLANDSTATTRGGANNVLYQIMEELVQKPDPGPDDEEPVVDPEA